MSLCDWGDEVWVVDCEFQPRAGRVVPVAYCAYELFSDRKIRLFQPQILRRKSAPHRTDKRAIFVAYSVMAELSVFKSMGWPYPKAIIDLMYEFKWYRNLAVKKKHNSELLHVPKPKSYKLIDACAYFGFDTISIEEKRSMIQLILYGEPWDRDDRKAILDYCWGDVAMTTKLLKKLESCVETPRSLARGEAGRVYTEITSNGLPVDGRMIAHLGENWERMRLKLAKDMNRRYRMKLFEGESFRQDNFAELLLRDDIPWPRTPTGKLSVRARTFSDQTAAYPQLKPLHETLKLLKENPAHNLTYSQDGLIHYPGALPYNQLSGRTSPIGSLFGRSKWSRSLILPPEGEAIASLDYRAQEAITAAVLANDEGLIQAYSQGDLYTNVGIEMGLIPAGSEKDNHPELRNLCKVLTLAMLYGITPYGLATRVGGFHQARRLHRLFRMSRPRLFEYLDQRVRNAMLFGVSYTRLKWRVLTTDETNTRAIANFGIQGSSADMTRLAAMFAIDSGVKVGITVHDSLVITAPISEIDDAVDCTRDCMLKASRIILNGHGCDVEANVFTGRYREDKPAAWEMFLKVLEMTKYKGVVTPA